MAELAEQPTPDVDVFCPHCGGRPVYGPDEQAAVQHRLSATGYLHDDLKFRCSECGEHWAHGMPVGEYDVADHVDQLTCHSCRHDPACEHDQYYRVKGVLLTRLPSPGGPGQVKLVLKCPRCKLHSTVKRHLTDQDGTPGLLVGYPDVTGAVTD